MRRTKEFVHKGGFCLRILLGLSDETRMLLLRDVLENRDEHTACTLCNSGREVLQWVQKMACDVLILDSVLKEIDGHSVLNSFVQRPLWHCPYVLFVGETKQADGCLSREADSLAFLPMVDQVLKGPAPYFYEATRAKREERARKLLIQMNMPAHLSGTDYLACMIPLALSNPQYREQYKFALYPYAAKRFKVSPSSVERCVRHAIETTFSHGKLAAIEGLFGQSYDPEKGKPTNREFIAMCLIHLKEEYDI